MKRARTETFEHTISGLLTKRADLFGEAERLRDRLAEIKNDISALDRTLTTLGYEGDLDAVMPRQKREVIFGRGELTRSIMSVLREAEGPMTSRQIAQTIISMGGHDARDRRYVSDLTKRVSKALRKAKQAGNVRQATDPNGNLVWSSAG
jgi:hypothetical protein